MTEGLDFAGLHFQRPLWLLGLLALPLLAWLWQLRQRRRNVWRSSVDAHLLPHLLQGGAGSGRGPWLVLAGLATAVIALSGPGWQRAQQPMWQTHAPLVIALDLSSAADATDLSPTRLAQARAKIAQLLKARRGGQVALVAYAGDAFTVAPLTEDFANATLFLDSLAPDVMPTDGNAANRAIEWSVRLLRQTGFDHGDILLLTGEANNAARSAANDAVAQGFRVSVLGLGTAAGAALRWPDGSISQVRLDAQGLQAVARAGGGRYAALQISDADLTALGVLDPANAGASATRTRSGSSWQGSWQDQGFWLLPLLLLLAALGFRRGGALTVLMVVFCLPPAPAWAQTIAPTTAKTEASSTRAGSTKASSGKAGSGKAGSGKASSEMVSPLEGNLWQRPDQQAHQRMQQGQQAYRNKDYAAAAEAFGAVNTADAAYNLGNALARQGRYEEAISAYDRALNQSPGMADAQANREAVAAAMARKPPQGANQKQPNPRNDSPQGQSQSRDGQQGDPSQGKGQKDSRQAQQPQKQPPSQQDASQQDAQTDADPAQQPAPATQSEDQRAADAAQRERMQQAMARQRQAEQGKTDQAKTDQGKDQPGRPETAEQAAQRERAMATEALLRRVPDDPGALLRAKFELEYERRRAQGED